MHSSNLISRYTNIQIQFEDKGSHAPPQRATYHNAEGQEVSHHLDQLYEKETCRYIEFMLILANLPSEEGKKVCCFEYTLKDNHTFKVEVIHPFSIKVNDDSDQDDDQRRYQCLSQIAFRIEQCYGTTVGCNDSYENLLPPLRDYLKILPSSKKPY